MGALCFHSRQVLERLSWNLWASVVSRFFGTLEYQLRRRLETRFAERGLGEHIQFNETMELLTYISFADCVTASYPSSCIHMCMDQLHWQCINGRYKTPDRRSTRICHETPPILLRTLLGFAQLKKYITPHASTSRIALNVSSVFSIDLSLHKAGWFCVLR